MIKIGITGGIGSGKTTICKLIEKNFNYDIFYSDDIAKKLVYDDDIRDKIITIFGSESYKNNIYNTEYISNIVFKDKNKLNYLNNIFSIRMKKEFDLFCINKDVVIYESALIFEHDIKDEYGFDYIINIFAKEETIIDRIKHRNNLTEDVIKSILENQMNPILKMMKSDYVVNTELYNIEEQIINILNDILS